MVGTSKILTVSYGTFSCTLEGFDDSFNTMKAIAEYFRDLASDDRYFGAEPPTPDAEMLARIAEKEISRRVEARMEGDGIILRANEDGADAAAIPSPIASESEADAPKIETSAVAIAAATVAGVAATTDGNEDEEANAQDASPAASNTESPDTGSDVEVGDTPPASLLAASDPVNTDPEADALSQTETTETGDQAGSVASEATPDIVDADSVAAKLQRIRAVVGARASQNDAADDFSEDLNEPIETNLPQVADTEPEVSEPVAEAEERAPEDAVATEAEAAPEPAAETIDETESNDADHSPDAASDAAQEPGGDMIARVMARRARTPEDDENDVLLLENAEQSEEQPQPDESAPEQQASTATDNKDADTAPKPRVMRVKRAALEAALAADAATQDEAAEPATDLGVLDGADELDSYLDSQSPDAPADEDSALLAAIAEATGDDSAPLNEEGAAPQDSSANVFDTEPDTDDALNRLLDETDAQLQEPEGNRRRAAIAQLKAAVAATQAERDSGAVEEDSAEIENAFREDLDQVVRPRRARRGETRTERPRPAPLTLVASQRVDLDNEQAATADTTVRPRRVNASAQTPEADESGSFAEFAKARGAHELPDLMEAAAAYTSFVEGSAEFSRPQIMRRVRRLNPESFNREDVLQSFTALLREGRFTQIRKGRFQVTEDTRFHPERQAG